MLESYDRAPLDLLVRPAYRLSAFLITLFFVFPSIRLSGSGWVRSPEAEVLLDRPAVDIFDRDALRPGVDAHLLMQAERDAERGFEHGPLSCFKRSSVRLLRTSTAVEMFKS